MKRKLIDPNDKAYYPYCCRCGRCGGYYSVVYVIKHPGAPFVTCKQCGYKVDLHNLYL